MKYSKRLPKGVGRFKTSDGLSLCFGIAGRGPALLVPTPGWGASVDMYMKSLTPLERDFSVVYLDTRGSGRSDPPVKPTGYRFKNFLGDIEKLRHHLALDRWLIFAHSDASRQAMGYALEHSRTCHGVFIVDGTMTPWQELSDVSAALVGAAVTSAVLERTVNGYPAGALTRDDVLDDITLYWLTNTAISSARLNWENRVGLYNAANISIPAAVSVFPGENYEAARSWCPR